MRSRGLGWQLGVAFALVAVATALIAGVALSVVWQRQFESYIRGNLQDRAEGYALSYAHYYTVVGGWPSAMQLLTPSGTSGLRVDVFDAAGNKIADNADAVAALSGGGEVVAPPASAIAAVAPIIVQGRTVGSVRVWSLSPGGLLTTRDFEFRNSSVSGLLLAALVAVLLASAAGVLYSRRFARPITHVTETAAALRAGDEQARTGMSGEDPVGLLGRTLDEMADAVEADREAERRMTADVAHELRTPLQAIQATVEAMQDGVLPTGEKQLETVRNETIRLARLTDTILELARLERGAVALRREPLDPANPLLAALDTHRMLIESAALTLSESLERGLTVLGDSDRLTQAFGNLLSNAARYTPAGGHVTVRLEREASDAVVTVADTGIGITAEELDRIFVRFWRADEARSRATGGLGVGLAVVKEIVDRQGGSVTVESQPGEGTTFRVSLPLSLPQVPKAKPRTRTVKPRLGSADEGASQ